MQQMQILILKQFSMRITKKNNIEIWFLLLIVTGYTVFSAFVKPLGLENSLLFSIPYRVIVFFFSLFIIYRNFSFNKLRNVAVLAVLFFWLLYLLKTYISFNNDFYNPIFAQKFFEIYVRIIAIAGIPSLALLFIDYRKKDISQVAKGFFYTLLVMLSINLVYALIMPHHSFLSYIFSIYYISYGHLGTSLVLISLFYLLFKPAEHSLYLVNFALLLGIVTIIIAGARSPFLAFMVVIPYLLVLKRNMKLIITFLILLTLAIVAIYFLGKSQEYHIEFANRTYRWLFQGDNSLRTPLFERAIEIFKVNPIFGDRTHYEDGMYPHNIILELLMATGIVGFVLYIIKFLPVLKNYQLFIWGSKNTFFILFFALFLQYLVLSATSYTLYSVPEFLYFSSIIIGISLNFKNEENESNDGRRNPAGNN